MSLELTKNLPSKPVFNNAVSGTAIAAKAGPGFLFKVLATQPAANTATYIQWFNTAAADVIPGTTAPVWVQFVPAGASGFIDDFNNNAAFFSTAISFLAATTATGAVAPANAIQVSYLIA